jgi:hypothetical protein
MNKADIVKAKRIRLGLVAVAIVMAAASVLALFHPRTDPLMIRAVSAAVCLVASGLWILPAVGRISFSRCLHALVIANILLFMSLQQVDRWIHKTKWDAIYQEVAQLNTTSPFDFLAFGFFLSHTLRGGALLTIGVTGIWALNLLALMYLAQTEKDKEANHRGQRKFDPGRDKD